MNPKTASKRIRKGPQDQKPLGRHNALSIENEEMFIH